MTMQLQNNKKSSYFNLKVNEIFLSIQGESTNSGLPTIFIRLTGCPLRCQYCDTDYAFHDGNKMNSNEIIARLSSYQTRYVTVTGGEPLAQKNCEPLLILLCDYGYRVSLETSGALDVSNLDERVQKIIDIKTPGSGEADKNLYSNLQYLNTKDQIKFVICNHQDYQWSKEKIRQYQLQQHEILFSSSYHDLTATQLAEWILEDQLPVRLQIQLHKHLWGEVAGK